MNLQNGFAMRVNADDRHNTSRSAISRGKRIARDGSSIDLIGNRFAPIGS
jgi:hypothetical protein